MTKLTRACDTFKGAHYCNLTVVGSCHATNPKKRSDEILNGFDLIFFIQLNDHLEPWFLVQTQ